jgi:hypothetical protein
MVLSKAKSNRLASKAVVLDCQAGNLQTFVHFHYPPPICKGQPLSVGLFHCGFLRACGGFCGCLRTSPLDPAGPYRPHFTLSPPYFSRPRRRQNLEVRKHQNFARYKSVGYSRTFQAVGWRHCLAGGNSLPAAILRRCARGATVSACSICLTMPRAEVR